MMGLNIVLLIALIGSIALNQSIRDNPAQANREILPEMVRGARYNAFAPNPNFPDGKTLQAPVPGSIPHGVKRIYYEVKPADAQRAGEELQSPYTSSNPATTVALDRGTFVFQTFCTPCHGGAGKGDGAVVRHGYPAPPSLLAEQAMHLKDGQIFHILTYGQKNMPSYASQLSEEDRWKVILYVRSMQQSARPTAPLRVGQP